RTVCSSFRRAWSRWVRRLLRRLSRLRSLLWLHALLRLALLRSRAVLWGRLSGSRRRCSAVLPRPGILVGPYVLRLETRTLGVPKWSANLATRSLRRARILKLVHVTLSPPACGRSNCILFLTNDSQGRGYSTQVIRSFKRSAEPSPSVPNENAQPW